jgi:uncharacterized protein YndB with AHSA1/START domain
MSDRTVHLHRVLRAPPDRVYRAFVDAGAMAKWLPPNGYICSVHEMDPRVGGRFRMSFRNFAGGHELGFGGEYLELLPGQRLRYTDRFDNPHLPGTMEVTASFSPVPSGTELNVSQSGIPPAIPLDMCYLGWQQSLEQLARLVEPEASE